MNKFYPLAVVLFIFSLGSLSAQTLIEGKVFDRKGEMLPGANVYLEGTYDGTSTDEKGEYSFETEETGNQLLIISFIGFKDYRKEITINADRIRLEVELKESANSLDAVVITAGAFEASDERKAVVLKPIDIVTTAGGLADIYGVMNTLPGTMIVGEEGKLFVRGGDSYETKTFVDGMMVERPYFSSMPDVPSRGRFSPFLFKGTVFSSGGYSAEYGQALSSAMVLNTTDLAEESVSSISLMSLGLGGAHTQRWENSSLSVEGNYFHLGPYYALMPQRQDWQKAPQGFEGSMSFRQKTGKNGMLKIYTSYSTDDAEMKYPDPSDVTKDMNLSMKSDYFYFNATHRGILSEKWISKGGISLSNDRDKMGFNTDNLDEQVQAAEAKYTITYLPVEEIKIKAGGSVYFRDYTQDYFNSIETVNYENTFDDQVISGFAEGEFRIGPRFAIRAGGRYEYSNYLNRYNIAPRASLAFKTGDKAQVSLAYGNFYQNPSNEYLRFTNALDFEKADHYILNYQIMKNKRTFRVEAYYKEYHDLVKFDSLHNPDPTSYFNNGKGYARGIDVFWRDNSISTLDYWISYSYIDTERDYRDYPGSYTPHFVSNHNFTTVVKYFAIPLNTQFGVTYRFASGRPYNNPNTSQFMNERTKSYHDISMNISWLTNILDNFTVVFVSVSNLLGTDQVFGYNYSATPDNNGVYHSYSVEPSAKRMIFIGVFTSIQ